MASQIAAEPRDAHTTLVEPARVSPPHGATVPEITQPDDTQQAAPIGTPAVVQKGATRSTGDSDAITVTTAKLALVGGAAVGLAALFTAGLMRRKAMPALRELAAGALDLEIRIPLWLPVAVVGIGREILAYRQAVAAAKAALPPSQ